MQENLSNIIEAVIDFYYKKINYSWIHKSFHIFLDYLVINNNKIKLVSNMSEIKIPTDRETGRKRGFGFITFEEPKSAQEALSMDGKELGGRNIRVNIAQGKKESRGGGGGAPRSGGYAEGRRGQY